MQTNALLKQYCDEDDRVEFVNIYPKMLGANGKPRPELFKKDGVHLSQKGYALWTEMIKPHLRTVELPPVTRR